MKNQKWLGIAAVTTLALGSLAGCGSTGGSKEVSTNAGGGTASGGDTIKVGTNFEMTGGVAAFGQSALNGVKLAVKQINAAGGINGKKIELDSADNASKPDESTRAAQKLAADKVVAMIGPVTSTNTLAAVPVAMEKHIPLITSSATNPKVTVNDKTGKTNDWIFRSCFIDPFQGTVMANFSEKSLNAKTAAVYVDQTSDYSKGLEKFFKETFEKNGGKVIDEESYQAKDTDFKTVLTRIKEKNPDVIYVPGYYEEVGKIVKQAREMGMKQPMMGGDGWDAPQLAEIAGAANLNNTFISNHYASDDTAPEIQKFVSDFKSEYNNTTPDAMAVLGYDAMEMLADAIKRAGGTDPDKLRTALEQTKDFKAVTGTITLNSSHDPVKSAVVLEYKDGKQVFKDKINP